MKKLFYLITFALTISFVANAQIKQVYDKSQENQILSTVYSQWKFYPEQFYESVYKKYMEDYGNSDDWLKPLTEHAEKAKKKVIESHKEINVVYEQEVAKWNDRTNDWEYSSFDKDINKIKAKIEKQTKKFAENKVELANAQRLYDEYTRLNNKVAITQTAHLENEKRRKQYQEVIDEYKNLLVVCYQINSIYETAKICNEIKNK